MIVVNRQKVFHIEACTYT